jgi:hypothetical protein
MKCRLTTVQEFVEAIHWEKVRAHWYERQGHFREVAACQCRMRDLQEKLDRLQGGGRG